MSDKQENLGQNDASFIDTESNMAEKVVDSSFK
jgi:hypothetical protein